MSRDEIKQLQRERDQAMDIARTALSVMSDEQLLEVRGKLEGEIPSEVARCSRTLVTTPDESPVGQPASSAAACPGLS